MRPDRGEVNAIRVPQRQWNERARALSPLDCLDELLTFVAILVQRLLLKHAVRMGIGTAHKAKSLASPLIHLQGKVFQRVDYRTSLQGDKRNQKKSFIHKALQ
ncbi:hypothetical protein [Burkholderia ambifaria]|uniref:hypothetical protein n=1 Tax=Burkholderia ambifaria TaxID=152480 RepID=UPI0012FE60FC|nr:hypothetical protein [Burkholderia ambifaria]